MIWGAMDASSWIERSKTIGWYAPVTEMFVASGIGSIQTRPQAWQPCFPPPLSTHILSSWLLALSSTLNWPLLSSVLVLVSNPPPPPPPSSPLNVMPSRLMPVVRIPCTCAPHLVHSIHSTTLTRFITAAAETWKKISIFVCIPAYVYSVSFMYQIESNGIL